MLAGRASPDRIAVPRPPGLQLDQGSSGCRSFVSSVGGPATSHRTIVIRLRLDTGCREEAAFGGRHQITDSCLLSKLDFPAAAGGIAELIACANRRRFGR